MFDFQEKCYQCFYDRRKIELAVIGTGNNNLFNFHFLKLDMKTLKCLTENKIIQFLINSYKLKQLHEANVSLTSDNLVLQEKKQKNRQ